MIKIDIKKGLCTFTLLLALPLFASAKDYWLTLKYAQTEFDNGNYGTALSLAEQAKDDRKTQSINELNTLEQIQKISAVRRAGDFLDEIKPILEKKGQSRALTIIKNYEEMYGSDFFEKRYSKLIEFLTKNEKYPEADFLIGKVYRLEGENALALKFMDEALRSSDMLSIPDVKYDILYELASIAKDQKNDEAYEKYMLSVLKDDKCYSDNITNPDRYSFLTSLVRVMNPEKDKEAALTKFFLLYRNPNDISIQALAGLTDYYVRKNQRAKALRCAALGTITALTKIQDILEDRITDYSYTNLEDLLQKASMYSDIVDWGNRNGIWEMFYNLADVAYNNDCKVFALALLNILKDNEPEPYWRLCAQRSLSLKEEKNAVEPLVQY